MEFTVQWEGHICQELGLSVARQKGGVRKSIPGQGGSVVREVLCAVN